MKIHSISGRRKKQISLYLLMLPGLLYLLINNYIPMCGVFIAFKKINTTLGIFKSEWVGFRNFEFLFKTSDAFIITRNTVLYNLVFIFLKIVLGIAVAIFLNDMRRRKLAGFFQSSLLLPSLVSMVIVSYLVFAFLSSENGYMNKTILPFIGMAPISWYSTKGVWPVILTIVNCWCSIGTSAIIFLSTLVSIDTSYYEAAQIDGAGRWKRIRYVTLPCLKPTVIMLTLMYISGIFYSNFGLFYLVTMNSGMLYDVTSTIDTYIYNGLMKLNDISMSSAACFYQSTVGFILVVTSNAIVRKLDPENALF